MGGRRSILGPTVAGTWYPADPAELRDLIARLLDAAEGDTRHPTALVVPHAGYVYSGSVAAAGFARLVDLACDRVLLLGPSHHGAFQGAALPAAEIYRTPLGDVPLDVASLRSLEGQAGFRTDARPFLQEHCLDAEVPLLQATLKPEWKLLPVLIGAGSSEESLARVADGLRTAMSPDTRIVVSTDFTHYGERFGYTPDFPGDRRSGLERLDMGAIQPILAGDREAFTEYVRRTRITVCGRSALSVLLRLLAAGTRGELIAYDTSGRMTGDWDHSVSYASLSLSEVGT